MPTACATRRRTEARRRASARVGYIPVSQPDRASGRGFPLLPPGAVPHAPWSLPVAPAARAPAGRAPHPRARCLTETRRCCALPSEPIRGTQPRSRRSLPRHASHLATPACRGHGTPGCCRRCDRPHAAPRRNGGCNPTRPGAASG